MKQPTFTSIAVHPAKISEDGATVVGVWLGRKLSAEERTKIMAGNEDCAGHIGVRKNLHGGTAVLHVFRAKTSTQARTAVAKLAKLVAKATGSKAILRELPRVIDVDRALAA